MNGLLMQVEQLSPFLQTLIASSLMAILFWIGRVGLDRGKRATKFTIRVFAKDYLFKHWLYKNLVNSPKPVNHTIGYLFVLTMAIQWVIRGTLTILFFVGVWAILRHEWLILTAVYLTFNCFLEAGSWLKDWENDKRVAIIPQEIKDEFDADRRAADDTRGPTESV